MTGEIKDTLQLTKLTCRGSDQDGTGNKFLSYKETQIYWPLERRNFHCLLVASSHSTEFSPTWLIP